MATRFHVGPNGPGVCRARPESGRSCPFGGESGEENHYATIEEAEAAFEERMEADGAGAVPTSKNRPAAKPALKQTIQHRVRSSFDALIQDSSFGVSRDEKTGSFVADSTEGLERFRDELTDRVGMEFIEPVTYYAEDTDREVVGSVYFKELDLEILNQNAEEDERELAQFQRMRAADRREYWR